MSLVSSDDKDVEFDLPDVEKMLKERLEAASQNGAIHKELFDILHADRDQLSEPDGDYKILEAIWLELGYDDSDEESEKRDELEYTMERVWYFGSEVVETVSV